MKLKAADILKTERIVSLSSESKLSEALARFKSSHDAIMVVDHGQFYGLVTPYNVLIKRTFPVSTKLKNCLFSPPKLSLETPLSEVSRLILESKVHYLPVVDGASQLLGIVTARRVLKANLDNPIANSPVLDLLLNKGYLQTINIESEIAELLRFFHRAKFSKIVIVNRQNNLQGIVSLFDILPIYEQPKERKGFHDRGEQLKSKEKYTIKHFLKTALIRASLKTSLKEIIQSILDKEIGSVIVMKNSLQPENIVTTSDLLRFLLEQK